jgi:hypothetical protein
MGSSGISGRVTVDHAGNPDDAAAWHRLRAAAVRLLELLTESQGLEEHDWGADIDAVLSDARGPAPGPEPVGDAPTLCPPEVASGAGTTTERAKPTPLPPRN